MHDLKWDDLYITPQEFIDLFTKAAMESMYFKGSWDKTWHPEDLYYNMESVLEGMGNGLSVYLGLVGERMRASKFGQTTPARTQVFGGTVPSSEFKNYTPSYTGNKV